MAPRRSVVLTRHCEAIERFLREFEGLIAMCQVVPTFGRMPTWQPRQGREHDAARQRGVIDLVSGPAARAVESVGATFQYKPRGTMRTVTANAVMLWSTLLSDDPMVTVELIYSGCNLALGLLTTDIEEAIEHERSIEGKIERAVGTPWRLVRAAFGGTAYAPKADAVGTIIVSIIAGLVVAYVAHWFHWG